MGEEREETVRWAYTGRRYGLTDGGGIIHVYLDEHGEDKIFTKPLGGGKGSDILGGLYEGVIAYREDGHTVAMGKWKWCGQYADEQLLVEWRASEEAALAEKKYEDKRKKAQKSNPLYDSLGPIKAAYRRTNAAGKRAILAQVIEFISR